MFESVAGIVNKSQDFPDTVDLHLQCFGEYDYVVQIDQDELSFDGFKDNVHSSLESFRCISEFKWHADYSV